MSVFSYLNFNGNAKEAIYFYKEAFNSPDPEIMYFRDMPPDEKFPVTDENKDLVMHASLVINGTPVMFADATGDERVNFDGNITLMVDSDDIGYIRDAYDKLSEEGFVIMELQETFWSKAYGFLNDKFGIDWQFNHNSE